MHNYIDIGGGREARQTYSLSNIGLSPARRTRSSKDVDTTWNFDAYTFSIPFLNHPTDALADPAFAIEMGRQGGLGVINAEGLFSRVEDVKAAVAEITSSTNPIKVLQKYHQMPLNEDLLSERIKEIRASQETVAVRVSPQRARELAPVVIKAGCEILFIQGTVISAEHVARDGEPLNLKDFIMSLDVPVVAGGVSDYTTALHLMRSGAAGVIAGSGETINDVTMGIGVGSATAIAEVTAARRDYLDETEGRYVHIIANFDDIWSTGQAVKAIACGADAVMLGRPLCFAEEALGQGSYWEHAAGHPRFPRAGILFSFPEEEPVVDRDTLETILHGPSDDTNGRLNFTGALKRAMGKCGYTELKKFQRTPLTYTIE